MKRVQSLIAVMIYLLCVNMLVVSVGAFDAEITDKEYVYYEDGSYAIISMRESISRANTGASKDYYYYSPDGDLCFVYTLMAEFYYNGTTRRAESASSSEDIYVRGWGSTSNREWTSGATAYGKATFSGPNGEERNVSLSLTCDKNGNVK